MGAVVLQTELSLRDGALCCCGWPVLLLRVRYTWRVTTHKRFNKDWWQWNPHHARIKLLNAQAAEIHRSTLRRCLQVFISRWLYYVWGGSPKENTKLMKSGLGIKHSDDNGFLFMAESQHHQFMFIVCDIWDGTSTWSLKINLMVYPMKKKKRINHFFW